MAHAEIGQNAGTGIKVIAWGGEFDMTYELDGADGYMPNWWFLDDDDFETPANPIAFLDNVPDLDFL